MPEPDRPFSCNSNAGGELTTGIVTAAAGGLGAFKAEFDVSRVASGSSAGAAPVAVASREDDERGER
jgi:hypothetical protein